MKKRFAVFRNRDDLPEMTLPLAVLTLLTIPVSAAFGAKAAGYGSYGAILSVGLLTISTTAYAALILLWRRLAAIAATPLSVLALLWSGASRFTTAALSLGILFLAYTLAVSALSKETRYRRTATLSCAVVLCILLAGTAQIGLRFSSFGDFMRFFREWVVERASLLLEARASSFSTETLETFSTAVSEQETTAAAASLAALTPVCIGTAGALYAWATEGLLRILLAQFHVVEDFLPRTHRITLPKLHAVLCIGITALMLFTSAEANPLLYAVLRNLFLTTAPPCLYLGCVKLRRHIMIRLYFLRGKRTASIFLLLFVVMALGASAFAILFSLLGAACALRYYRRMGERSCKNRDDLETRR